MCPEQGIAILGKRAERSVSMQGLPECFPRIDVIALGCQGFFPALPQPCGRDLLSHVDAMSQSMSLCFEMKPAPARLRARLALVPVGGP